MMSFSGGESVSRKAVRFCVILSLVVSGLAPAAASERQFPFDQELLLDAKPLAGTKRVPSLEIDAKGGVSIDLWCNSVQGQIVVVDDTISVLTGPKTNRTCPEDRARYDDRLLSILTQVTTWRREGDAIVLSGPQSVRFRIPSN
jgi:heat shock protein HslJ